MITNCRKCNAETQKWNHGMCRDCYNASQRAYRRNRPDKFAVYYKRQYARNKQNPAKMIAERKRGREYWQQLRHEVIMAYGGYVCTCCGETEPMFLSIDHVNNDGAKHRRAIGEFKSNGKGAGSRTLKWLKDNGYPRGFQVLCMNCNCGKQRNKGFCPHHVSTPRKTALTRETSRPDNSEPRLIWSEGMYAPTVQGVETIM